MSPSAPQTRGNLSAQEKLTSVSDAVGFRVRRGARAGSHMDADDLIHDVFEALITKENRRAVTDISSHSDTFPEKRSSSSVWSATSINNAISDVLRTHDSLTRKDRAVVRNARGMQARLSAELGRSVTKSEIAAAMGETQGTLLSVLAKERAAEPVDAFALMGGEGPLVSEANGSAEEIVVANETVREVRAMAAREFTSRDNDIITAIVFEKEANKDVAARFGVSPGRVSQIVDKYKAHAKGILFRDLRD